MGVLQSGHAAPLARPTYWKSMLLAESGPQISLHLRNQGKKVETGSRGFMPNDVFNRSAA